MFRQNPVTDYLKQGLKKTTGVSTTPDLAVGTEFCPINYFPLRAGFSLGGNQGFSMSGGFAFDFSVVSLDFAIASRRGMFSGKGLAFPFGWMFRP
ncbi:hypothetical protein GWO43_07305 [candidate division KSB1 bacterium]|nr:hypothetical protein [candidate division KSB1 bacterium]NIT70692.1 hypothetical protein [candidate division KSB1 bacterium]NIX70373.1 hypothetical protein [candidate division KSB1 bacterium]